MTARVLVVEDDPAFAEALTEGLVERGYEATSSTSAEDAKERIRGDALDALVTDLRMPGASGLELLSLSREAAPDRPVIVMTAFGAVDSAIESVRRGAFHYLTKPFRVDQLVLFLERALEGASLAREASALRRRLLDEAGFGPIVTTSPGMRDVCDTLGRLVDAPVPVLLTGETGTGKGLLARALHDAGERRRGRFVTVQCAALPEPLLESELFGHVKGAFTGALHAREGLVTSASGGTLLLDEIGEMPLGMQVKLLDVLERGVVRPLGSDREQPVDLRVVSATHRDLAKLVAEGSFRADLYYRLAGVALEVPALRDRQADVPRLALHFLDRVRSQHRSVAARTFSPDAMRRLVEAGWPGNVRELKLAVERAAFLARAETIGEDDLPPLVRAPTTHEGTLPRDRVIPLREVQRRYARWALERLGGRKTLASEELGIDPKTLNRLLDGED